MTEKSCEMTDVKCPALNGFSCSLLTPSERPLNFLDVECECSGLEGICLCLPRVLVWRPGPWGAKVGMWWSFKKWGPVGGS